jgi:hypothetical protein
MEQLDPEVITLADEVAQMAGSLGTGEETDLQLYQLDAAAIYDRCCIMFGAIRLLARTIFAQEAAILARPLCNNVEGERSRGPALLRIGKDLRLVRPEDGRKIRSWLVDRIDQSRDPRRHHQKVFRVDVACVPVCVRHVATSEDTSPRFGNDLVVAESEAEPP